MKYFKSIKHLEKRLQNKSFVLDEPTIQVAGRKYFLLENGTNLEMDYDFVIYENERTSRVIEITFYSPGFAVNLSKEYYCPSYKSVEVNEYEKRRVCISFKRHNS